MPSDLGSVAVGVLDYPGAQASAVLGLTDLFQTANMVSVQRSPADPPPLDVSHWALASSPSRVIGTYGAEGEEFEQLGALIVPPSLGPGERDAFSPVLTNWIQAQHAGGAVVCSICAGAFLLGEAGLLEGRPATTHWTLKDRFAAQFPGVKVETEKLVLEDGDIITAGGVMAWVDLGLRVIDRFAGTQIMLQVARFFLVDPGGREQSFYSTFAPRLDHGDAAILKAQRWLQSNFETPVSVADMAGVAGLTERTFLRRFRRATGMNPTAYVQSLRVGKARDLLELTAQPFSQIAWQVGYSDPAAFSAVFQKIMGLGPAEYRRRFSVR